MHHLISLLCYVYIYIHIYIMNNANSTSTYKCTDLLFTSRSIIYYILRNVKRQIANVLYLCYMKGLQSQTNCLKKNTLDGTWTLNPQSSPESWKDPPLPLFAGCDEPMICSVGVKLCFSSIHLGYIVHAFNTCDSHLDYIMHAFNTSWLYSACRQYTLVI